MAKKAKRKATRKALKPKDLSALRGAANVKGGITGPCQVKRRLN